MSANRRHRRGRVAPLSLLAASCGFDNSVGFGSVDACGVSLRNDSGRTIRAGEMVYLTPMGGIAPVDMSGLMEFPAYASQTTTIDADWVKRNPRQVLGGYAVKAVCYPTTLGPGVDGDLPALDEDF